MEINPKTHHNHRLLDCAKTIYPKQDEPPSTALIKESVLLAIENPFCFESLPSYQRELLISRAGVLNMTDEAARLRVIDRFARKMTAHRRHPVDYAPSLNIRAVVPRILLGIALGAGLLLVSCAFALFSY